MPGTAALRALLSGGESDRVELMTPTGNPDEFGEAVCALANDFQGSGQPGHLLVGVDRDGRPSGLTVTDGLLRQLGELRSDVRLEPSAAMTVRKHSLPGGEVAVVSVPPSDLPPVRYRGRAWIRVGPLRCPAGRQDERVLTERRAGFALPFDLQPRTGCGLDDLDFDGFPGTGHPSAAADADTRRGDRDSIGRLTRLGFFDRAAGCPTNAAAVLFARDPQRRIPGSRIEFASWPGTVAGEEPVASRTLAGNLVTVLRGIGSSGPFPPRSGVAARSFLAGLAPGGYPAVALRELLLNAVMHRSYESNAPVRFDRFADRIEIQSPGGLYGMASPENFPTQTDYRNPVIAEAMATLGYVNRFGRGVLRAREALHRNGNPEARFRFDRSFVLATIPRKR